MQRRLLMRNVIFFSGEMIPIARLTQQMDLSEDSGHPPHHPSKGRGRAEALQIDKLHTLQKYWRVLKYFLSRAIGVKFWKQNCAVNLLPRMEKRQTGQSYIAQCRYEATFIFY